MLSEKKFLHIIENLNDIIWTIDIISSRFTYVSPSVTQLGYLIEEAMEGAFDKHPNNNTSYKKTQLQIQDEIKRLITSDEEYSDMRFEYQMPNKAGTQIWVETEIRILKEDGYPKEILGITRNIEDRKKNDLIIENYARELERLNYEKDQFIKILAHDLLSPFNTMLGFSNHILETFKETGKEDLEPQLKLINHKLLSTFQMLEDLLVWVKNSSSEIFSTFEDVPLNKLCNTIIKNVASNFKNISVVYIESENIILKTNTNILKVILRNFISNAIKFTDINGSIEVLASKSPENVTITVSDNGIGMTDEQIENIWQKSESCNGTKGETGFGLGLVFCKELIEKLGGKIWAESELGKGSKFNISLPNNTN
ncbi:PAS domain-containing sensor histidine kinase [uncultured Draconibacterium sp.]|uniref:PAS domain-containing sensor histidine kinase n=1 Tax=uncultured Draconibacterium sp. TaxID=1573823 RepID=UPI0032168AD3